MAAREKPQAGVSGVPFMKRTTGAEATAASIADFVSAERRRIWKGVKREGLMKEGRRAVVAGRNAWRARPYWMLVGGSERVRHEVCEQM